MSDGVIAVEAVRRPHPGCRRRCANSGTRRRAACGGARLMVSGGRTGAAFSFRTGRLITSRRLREDNVSATLASNAPVG
jgi:hypothetical protein